MISRLLEQLICWFAEIKNELRLGWQGSFG